MQTHTLSAVILPLLFLACGDSDGKSSTTPTDAAAPAMDGGVMNSDAAAPADATPPPGDATPPPGDAAVAEFATRVEVRTGEASVLLRATDTRTNGVVDIDLTLYSATVTFRDAQGTDLQTVTSDLGTQGSTGSGWVRELWWPATTLPTQAEVQIFGRLANQRPEDASLVRTETVAITPVPVVADACSASGFDNRCPTGQGCLVDEDGAGSCHPLDIHVWERFDDRFMYDLMGVDVRADAPHAPRNVEVHLLAGDELTRVLLRSYPAEGAWRGAAQGPAPAGPFSFYFGPHLYAAGMALETLPARALGEPCDPLRFADGCGQGAACNDDAVCATITPPVIETLTPYYDYDSELLVVRFTGQDPERDIDRLDVELLPAGGGDAETFFADIGGRQMHPLRWGYGQLEYAEDGAFTGTWYATRDADIVPHFRLDSDIPARSRFNLILTDSERQDSERVEATILPALPPSDAAVNAACDLSRVLYSCAEGSFCALAQGDSLARCHRPAMGCDGPWEVLPFTPPMVEGDVSTGPDVTIGYCSRQRGNLGIEQVYEYVPEATGTHTFRFTGRVSTLFIRRHCTLRGAFESEFACARATEGGGAANQETVSLEAELQAGVPVYLFMEGPWSTGGAYTLSVEIP